MSVGRVRLPNGVMVRCEHDGCGRPADWWDDPANLFLCRDHLVERDARAALVTRMRSRKRRLPIWRLKHV